MSTSRHPCVWHLEACQLVDIYDLPKPSNQFQVLFRCIKPAPAI